MKGYATTVYIKGLEPLPARALYALTEDRWDGLDGCPLCAVSNSESGATNENDETL
jgi:hypothetical protein